MIHQMKLQPKYYNYMKDGSKRIEIRLNDEKRKRIHVGDKIVFFKEPDLEESLKTEVVGLVQYSNIQELVEDYNISLLADKSEKKEDLLSELKKFYPEEKQEKYGVLSIKIKK